MKCTFKNLLLHNFVLYVLSLVMFNLAIIKISSDKHRKIVVMHRILFNTHHKHYKKTCIKHHNIVECISQDYQITEGYEHISQKF